ncbi:hypothetical protein [Pseudomonas sp. H2_H03]
MKIWLIPASDNIATQNLSRSLENEIDVEVRQVMLEKELPFQYAWGARLGKKWLQSQWLSAYVRWRHLLFLYRR